MAAQTTQNVFEMEVVEVFHFDDGRTVLVGRIEGDAYVGPCDGELVVDDAERQRLRIEGEMLTDAKHPDGYRSISTRSPVELDAAELKARRCVVRSVAAP
jgi:hypothetical protein